MAITSVASETHVKVCSSNVVSNVVQERCASGNAITMSLDGAHARNSERILCRHGGEKVQQKDVIENTDERVDCILSAQCYA